MRSAGFNNVDIKAAAAHHIKVLRVPAYSPQAVAEHAAAQDAQRAAELTLHHLDHIEQSVKLESVEESVDLEDVFKL